MKDDRTGKGDNRIHYGLTALEIPKITRIIYPVSRIRRIINKILRRK